ncbi:uncharacterized protein LOC117552821 [Gymnodraco acuticeps]|uniref:Uncharacterized protein LOC117552821 n=1 Tax=Gymnodraco acuticeps TaxID=8218 RepID=A0A6P8UZ73_GYMAC|nr:uncharacterized protein LOC117552821 [Gymnodraco acuticeps]
MLQTEGRPLVLGGAGRADSPGHCAKFGTYTTMELESNVVLDLQLVQSNECGGSYHMELEGLKRMVAFFEDILEIGTLVTDRHRQIAKWIRENMPYTKHLYDIWHVAKSVGKKLKAICKLKGCEDLKAWQQSIINHLYWAVVSSTQDNAELIVDKWKSVERHVLNLHSGHGGKFPTCAHKRLQGRAHKKKWIKPSSLSAVKLVTDKMLCKDIGKLSAVHQTSKVEGFHSLIIQFAPKSYVYSYTGMLCRTLLAGLHYNENASRHTATTKAGEQRFKIRYPKYKAGGHVVKKILVEATFSYVDDLMREVVDLCKKPSADRPVQLEEPPTLSSAMEKPDKAEAIKAHASRFKTK